MLLFNVVELLDLAALSRSFRERDDSSVNPCSAGLLASDWLVLLLDRPEWERPCLHISSFFGRETRVIP
jgi:hypothetical protein